MRAGRWAWGKAGGPSSLTARAGFAALVRQPKVVAVRNAAPATTGALAVPGDNVLTTVPQGAYDFMSGSSFSAPQVAGLFALMLEIRPSLDAHAALKLLRASLSPTEPRWIDACAALAKLSGANPATGCS